MKQSSRILWQGSCSANRVKIRHVASTRVSTPHIDREVELVWQKQQAKAKQQGYELWDAEGYRLDDFSVAKGVLLLEVADVPYRVHSAMKELYTDPNVHKEHFDKLIAADALIRTDDGVYILAQVDKVAEQEVVLIGGSCTEKRLQLDDAQDLFHFLIQRIADVLNIPKAAIEPPAYASSQSPRNSLSAGSLKTRKLRDQDG